MLAGLTAIFVFRLMLAIAVVPPWQHPDEPAHLARASIYAAQAELDLSEREDHALERVLLASMDQHGWWHAYHRQAPEPPPESFSHPDVSPHVARQTDTAATYYLPAGLLLKGLRLRDPLQQQYALRWLSLVLAVGTFWCTWAGTRRFFGDEVAAGATAVVALHPQFALFSTAVTPEALVNLCGAIVWWQGARFLCGERDERFAATGYRIAEVTAVAGLLLAAATGVFAKRVGAPLLPATALIFALGSRGALRATLAAVTKPLSLALVGAVGLAALVWLLPEPSSRVWRYWSELLFLPADLRPRIPDLDFFTGWITGLFQSAWLYAGWLRFPAPPAWYWTMFGLSVISVAGLIPACVRCPGAHARAGLVVAGGWLLFEIAMMYIGFFRNGLAVQGHYFFGLIGPWAALFWLGLVGWWPPRLRPAVGVCLIALLAVLDLSGWALVTGLAYLS